MNRLSILVTLALWSSACGSPASSVEADAGAPVSIDAASPPPDAGTAARVLATMPRGLYFNSVHLASDGSIVVVGNDSNTSQAVVAHILSAGGLDPSFGDHGVVVVPAAMLVGAATGANGTIFVVGQAGGVAPTIWRLKGTGEIDMSYGFNGGANIPETGRFLALTVDPSGAVSAIGDNSESGDTTILTARFQANGLADTTYGTAGYTKILRSHLDGYYEWRRLEAGGWIAPALETDTATGTRHGRMVRITGAGALATDFGSGGLVEDEFVDGNLWAAASGERVVIGYLKGVSPNFQSVVGARRLDGSVDATFHGGVPFALRGDEQIGTIVVMRDGTSRVLVTRQTTDYSAEIMIHRLDTAGTEVGPPIDTGLESNSGAELAAVELGDGGLMIEYGLGEETRVAAMNP